jgi:hypothetical protein
MALKRVKINAISCHLIWSTQTNGLISKTYTRFTAQKSLWTVRSVMCGFRLLLRRLLIVLQLLLSYYHCSCERRGLEYRMAQRYDQLYQDQPPHPNSNVRAVKFIRDQAQAAVATGIETQGERRSTTNPAHAAAIALRKILTGDVWDKLSSDPTDGPPKQVSISNDPLSGWIEGVSLRKSHFGFLLNPQIVLRSEIGSNSTCVLAAVQAKLQSFQIIDDLNAEDHVCGKVMTR